jgi:multidrug resistance efflux pump
MARSHSSRLLYLVLLVGIAGLISAEEPKSQDGKKSAASTEKKDLLPSDKPAAKKTDESAAKCEKNAAYTVKRKPLKVTLVLDGVFAAEKAYEIFIKPEEWNTLRVESAASHGAQVQKGEVILSLDTEKIDLAIKDLQADLKLGKISVQQNEEQLQALDKLTPLDLQAGQRSARIGEEDRKYFADVTRPFAIKLADFRLKMAEVALEYEQEELRQLEKMYKADEITEETEQIVLKRARDTVEKAKFTVDYIKLDRDQTLKFDIPRAGESIEDSAQRRSIDWEKIKIELPLTVSKQRLELEKLRLAQDKNDDRLKKLLADRDMMTVKSPIDGIVYYGKSVRGKFSDSNSLAESLRPNGSIMPNQIVMTVVEPRPMSITATVPETQLHYLRPGLKGIATPTGYPDLKLSTEIDDVTDVPTAPGSFDAGLAVTLSRKSKWIMPGMSCKVKLVPYLKKDALVVPPKYIQTDDVDEDKNFVWVLDKDGKPQRRDIKVGEKTDKHVEILKGLTEGEKVSIEGPKEQE